MKDHDVTWLYGPLQANTFRPSYGYPTPPVSQLSRTDSFLGKKPILKKRSPSELMLQRSLSSATLVKQATDAVQAQNPRLSPRSRRRHHQPAPVASVDGMETPLARVTTYPGSSHLAASPGTSTPRRHIHFNDRVEQCIAIDKERNRFCVPEENIDDESDDELLTMKPVRDSPTPTEDGKTIAMLPSTTLNYRSDTPEPTDTSSSSSSPRQKERWWKSVARNASQRTFLAPAFDKFPGERLHQGYPTAPTLSNNIYDEEDDYEDYNGDSVPLEPGLRRTPSGMFMPNDDDHDDAAQDGLLGRVVDTVNTARDIAHVIWNVGWHG